MMQVVAALAAAARAPWSLSHKRCIDFGALLSHNGRWLTLACSARCCCSAAADSHTR